MQYTPTTNVAGVYRSLCRKNVEECKQKPSFAACRLRPYAVWSRLLLFALVPEVSPLAAAVGAVAVAERLFLTTFIVEAEAGGNHFYRFHFNHLYLGFDICFLVHNRSN